MKKTITLFTADQVAALRGAFHNILCEDFTTKEHHEADKWFDAILRTASMNLVQAAAFDHVISNFTTKEKKPSVKLPKNFGKMKTTVAKKTTTKTKKHARK